MYWRVGSCASPTFFLQIVIKFLKDWARLRLFADAARNWVLLEFRTWLWNAVNIHQNHHVISRNLKVPDTTMNQRCFREPKVNARWIHLASNRDFMKIDHQLSTLLYGANTLWWFWKQVFVQGIFEVSGCIQN